MHHVSNNKKKEAIISYVVSIRLASEIHTTQNKVDPLKNRSQYRTIGTIS